MNVFATLLLAIILSVGPSLFYAEAFREQGLEQTSPSESDADVVKRDHQQIQRELEEIRRHVERLRRTRETRPAGPRPSPLVDSGTR